MRRQRILHIVGARPNLVKIAPVMRELALHPDVFEQVLVHTGQHYDDCLSKVFLEELEMPPADVNLAVGSGSHAWQTAQIMLRVEPVIVAHQPDWVLVSGDVNSTVACALAATKLGVRIAHLEAGLRSLDRTMPEEINRVLTDHMADLLFTPSRDADENLAHEGIPRDRIRFVGNVMIDTLAHRLPSADKRWPALRQRFDLNDFLLVTLHRPNNVDHPAVLREFMGALDEIGRRLQVVFPVHPRTRRHLDMHAIRPPGSAILTEPLGYLDFLALQAHARLVLTDSGGIQEETTYLGIPCLTARDSTERPITLTAGTNRLVASECQAVIRAVQAVLDEGAGAPVERPELWDGRAAARIVEAFRETVS